MSKKRVSPLTEQEKEIAKRVKAAREKTPWTHETLAPELGLSKAGYGHYERAYQPFAVTQLFTLSRLLGKPVEYFLGLDTGLTDQEGELLTVYRNLPEELKPLALSAVKVFAGRK